MVLGRPKTFEPDAVLDYAMNCFWTNGYAATSTRDLLAHTGLSKSSLYDTFGSKHALFERCLIRYRKQHADMMMERLAASPCALGFIRDMLYSAATEAQRSDKPRGCFVMNTAAEFAQSDPVVARSVDQSIASFRRVFRRAVVRAQHEGSIPASKSPSLLACLIVSNMSGLRTLAKSGQSPRTLRATADEIVKALQH
jgi:TetR/AcrR family transcriptional regulator, transcriptional repressor for nem operon